MHEFKVLGFRDEIAQALSSFGFAAPTEIQTLAAASMLAGKDAFISSSTGSGKTFAYLAPIFSGIDPALGTVQAIVAAPTHDLAAQLFRETERLAEASGLGFRIAQALGSVPLSRQLQRLAAKPQVVVGSAGRIRDLISGGYLDASACRWLVLDEADRLFEKEAIDIAGDILDAVPQACARVLVSATIPERTVERSSKWFREPERLFLDSTESLRTSIEHWCFHAASRSKVEFLRKFEAAVKPERCLLFASSNAAIFTIARKLEYLGFSAAILKSDKEGNERKSAIEDFAAGRVRWLVTTDLGARGLDVPDVSHVLSFDLPEEPSVYVHRAGRTGRAGKHGVSIALADLVELKRASRIAVRYGFPFVCKILDSGVVHDIEPENFFALAEEEESVRKEVRLEAVRKPEGRRGGQQARTRSYGDQGPGGQGFGSPRQSDSRPRARAMAGLDPRENRENRDRRPMEPRRPADRQPYGDRRSQERQATDRQPQGDRQQPDGRRASRSGRHDQARTRTDQPRADQARTEQPRADRPQAPRPQPDKAQGERPAGEGRNKRKRRRGKGGHGSQAGQPGAPDAQPDAQ